LNHVAHEVLAEVLGGVLHAVNRLAEGQAIVLCRFEESEEEARSRR
jgi:hypothetical protein